MAFSLLSGVRVVDLGQYVPGPYAALMLQDLGAEVLKIEAPGGDPYRRMGPPDADGVSPFYKAVNAGKSVVELDLKSEAGRRTFESLLARADVLIESFRPGVLARLGFDDERLGRDFPRLVACSLSGYGQTGPYRLRAGHDLNYMAFAGSLGLTGTEETPVCPSPPVADYAGGLQTALTALAALVGRARTGRGARIDVSMAETVLAWQSFALSCLGRSGYSLERGHGDESGGAASYRTYRTADGRFVSLAAQEPHFWRNFCEAVGHPEWTARQGEPVPQTSLMAEVEAMFASRALADWRAKLDSVDCCFEAVHDLAEVKVHPHIAARGMLSSEEWPGPLVQALFPAWIDGVPPPRRDAPRFVAAEVAVRQWDAAPE